VEVKGSTTLRHGVEKPFYKNFKEDIIICLYVINATKQSLKYSGSISDTRNILHQKILPSKSAS